MNNHTEPSPDLFFDTATAYQKTAALKAAVDLGIFSHIGAGATTSDEIARRCGAATRGVRMLCDYLTVLGFLSKAGNAYTLTPSTAVFLDRSSPAYAGAAIDFLFSNDLVSAFDQLTESVKRGGTATGTGTTEVEHPVWLSFARTMGAIMAPAAAGLAELVPLDPSRPIKVLDISASHGSWGIAFGKKYPQAQVVALDWPSVLEISLEHARTAGLENRFSTIPGDAFKVALGSNYQIVLIPNFLHHFNRSQCVEFLKKTHEALDVGGRVAIVEFIPNEDRVTPPPSATFSLVMLATTPEGDAYTYNEYAGMLAEAGFAQPELHALPASANQALIAVKN